MTQKYKRLGSLDVFDFYKELYVYRNMCVLCMIMICIYVSAKIEF
jgi:hypothetical protein